MEQATSSLKCVASQSILNQAAKDSLTLDWHCIPPHSRIIISHVFHLTSMSILVMRKI